MSGIPGNRTRLGCDFPPITLVRNRNRPNAAIDNHSDIATKIVIALSTL